MKAAAVAVWLFYGLGGHLTSSGVDQVAAQLRARGAEVHGPYSYTSYAAAAASARASKAARKVFVGYSCGVGATEWAAEDAGVPVVLVGVQGSVYCPPRPLPKNVTAATEVYSSCALTMGLGCATYQRGASHGPIKLIERKLTHGAGQFDPYTQQIMVRAALGAS